MRKKIFEEKHLILILGHCHNNIDIEGLFFFQLPCILHPPDLNNCVRPKALQG